VTPAPVLFDPGPLVNHSRAFHTELRKLRSALYAEDPWRVAKAERELDQIVARWEQETKK
jgi:hypothetical protein